MKDCNFCDLGDRVIKSNEHANLFLSNPRKVPGHFLVTPKKHVEKPWDLEPVELLHTLDLVLQTQKALAKEYSSGADVRQNYRPYMKQGRIKMDHVHYHVLPREKDDEIYTQAEKTERRLFSDLPPEEIKKFTKLIKEVK